MGGLGIILSPTWEIMRYLNASFYLLYPCAPQHQDDSTSVRAPGSASYCDNRFLHQWQKPGL